MGCCGPVPTDRNEYLNHLLDHVAEHGFTVQHIRGDGSHPSYSHTVGLTALPHPEIVVTGAEVEDRGRLLRILGHDIAIHNARVEPGWVVLGDDGFTVFMHPITRQARRLWTAVDLYGHGASGLQALWADADGHWPWEAGYDAVAFPQPLLCRSPRRHELGCPPAAFVG